MNWLIYNKIDPKFKKYVEKPKLKITFGLILWIFWSIMTGTGCFVFEDNGSYIFMFLFGLVNLIHEIIYEIWK